MQEKLRLLETLYQESPPKTEEERREKALWEKDIAEKTKKILAIENKLKEE